MLSAPDSSKPQLAVASRLGSKRVRSKGLQWMDCLDDTTLALPRTRHCLQRIADDPLLDFSLPRVGSSAGQIVKHAQGVIQRTLSQKQPATFKIGFSHDPYTRFYNRVYGYVHDKDRWEGLCVLYVATDPVGPSFLEAALIQLFQGNMSFAIIDPFPFPFQNVSSLNMSSISFLEIITAKCCKGPISSISKKHI